MFRNYLKVAWRNLRKDRQSAILNLVGLSTGLACALLVYLWAMDELKVDRFHEKDGRLFQVLANQHNGGDVRTMPQTNAILARTLKNEMPEVEYAAAVLPNSWFGKVTLSAGNRHVKASGHFADPDFFHVFTYPLLEGRPDQVLAGRNAIVISRRMAQQLFHTSGPVTGRMVEWQHEQQYMVTGVFDDPPAGSSDQFDYLLPMDVFLDRFPYQKEWGNADPATYLVLREGADAGRFNKKLAGFMQARQKESGTTLFMRPYGDGYLHGRYENGVPVGGRIEYVRLFSVIAIFILVIACINFMNLSTARAAGKMKEVGVRKVAGAGRGTLAVQYLGESVLIAFCSLLLAILLVALLLPQFNSITGKQLSLREGSFLLPALGITLCTGLLAGSYPAFYLSGFRPAAVLKGQLKGSAGELWIRKGLVVFQFTLSVLFIIAVLVVYRQIQFIQHKHLGYNKNNILALDVTGGPPQRSIDFLEAVKNVPGIINASNMDHSSIIADYGGSSPSWEGQAPGQVVHFCNLGIGYGMIETLGLQVIQGRSFSRRLSADSAEVILNQAAVAALGLKDPIGKRMFLFDGDGNRKIVGVVRNFHFESMHETVKPFALRLEPRYAAAVMAKVQAGKEQQVLDRLQQLHAQYRPGFPFSYRFLDNDYQALHVAEQRIAVLSQYLGALAILISCLGLFGLATYTAQKRHKEIGIRKVLGATVANVALMLSGYFLRLVLVATLLAFPLAWWALNKWLNGFAYHIRIGPDVFLLAGISVALLALLTTGYQAVKAALANPVNSLKTE